MYPHIFITPDVDQGKISVEDSFILASHQFYAVMNYQHQLSDDDDNDDNLVIDRGSLIPQNSSLPTKKQRKPKQMLQFLMTKKEEIIDEETGQALQRLEDRNPQLAHTMEVMDSLEEELARIEAQETTTTNENGDDSGHNDTAAGQDDLESPPIVVDDEADVLASLDQLDLGELEGLDF